MAASQPLDFSQEEMIALLRQLSAGEYSSVREQLDSKSQDEIHAALAELASALASQAHQYKLINQLRAQINTGLLFDEVMENVYTSFRTLIPYNRIGVALIDRQQVVRARWVKSDREVIALGAGYVAPLAGSTLETILKTRQPRIINDLEVYLAVKPGSQSTQLMVEEGMRSSLTCPLISAGEPIGFLFFSSIYPDLYAELHTDIFMSLAGELSGLLEKGRMVSELAENARAIAQQNLRLEQLDELKNTFLRIVAHDLRNPLSFIKTASDMLLDKNQEDYLIHRQRILEGISRQVKHMLLLVNDLLHLSEIEAGPIDLDLERIALEGFLWEVVATQQQLAIPKGTHLELSITPGGLQVIADPNRLRQVVENLISNAVKYSPPNSCVQIMVEARGEFIWFGVQDEGPGIADEKKGLLFQSFARIGTLPTGGEESIGLGLAIARWLVEAHGGQIGVEPASQRGSVFWFTLPASIEQDLHTGDFAR